MLFIAASPRNDAAALPGRRALLWTLVMIRGLTSLPDCAFDINDRGCDVFDLGNKFVATKLGDVNCPADTKPVSDVATCKEAQQLTGFPFMQDSVDGSICFWCGGCQPQTFRVFTGMGSLAKRICKKEAAAAVQAAGAAVQGSGSAVKPPSTPWPECQEQNTVIRNAGQALFTNLQAYGATIGCFLDDCMSSDKFVAGEIESCTKVCHTLPECEFWVWGTEEGEQKCWFRTGDAGREAGDGWTSGRKACVPPGTEVLPMGNSECWSEGFGYMNCCDAKYGPNGNAQCWDGVYNYDRCCFPNEEL